jgi:hypothetical protein
MFARFKYSLARKDPSIIEAAKAEFLEHRERGGTDRAIALMDAEVLANSDLPDQELAFLKAARDYLVVRDSPLGQGSLSGLFWLQVRHETDADALLRDCETALASISKTYRALVASYAELEPTFRLSKNTIANGDAS